MGTQICYSRKTYMRGCEDVYEIEFKERISSSSGRTRSEFVGKDSKVAYGGVVYKGRLKLTGTIWASKAEKGGFSATTNKEIDILKSLGRHPSIVHLYDVKVRGDYMVAAMEYVETDLRSYIAYLDKEEVFTINQVKKLMLQLLQGVKFLHENGVVHGHLEPHNILIHKGGGNLKICNFGKATRFPPRFLEEGKYSGEVDMCSVGCIMAELVLDKLGEDEQDEVREIYRILGKPAAYSNNSNRITTSARFVLKEDGFDLLKGLLTRMITAKSAPNHVWFHDHQLHDHED